MNVQFVNLPRRVYAMTTTRRRTSRPSTKALIAGDRDRMKALMKDALREVLEAEMTELLGAAPNERAKASAFLLKAFGTRGIQITGFLGGLVNSTVTVTERVTTTESVQFGLPREVR